MPILRNLDASTAPDMVGLDNNPALILSSATVGPALRLTRNVVGSASIAALQFSVSGASIPLIDLQASSFVSAVSIVFAASANWAGMGGMRVKLSDGTTYGWIPIIPPASFTAATAS